MMDDAVYKIISADNGRVLSARDFGMQDGSLAELQGFAGDLNQAWRAVKQENGTYCFESLSAGRYLTLKRDDDEDGVWACVEPRDGASVLQQWEIGDLGDDLYTIKSAATQKYMQPKDNAKAAGTQIVQHTQADEGQRWEFVKLDDGSRKLPVMLQITGSLENSSTPEIRKVDGMYHLYYMHNNKGFGLGLKVSKDLRNWDMIGAMIDADPRNMPYEWMKEKVPKLTGGMWVPGVYKVGGTYCCYYAISVIYEQTSVIGLATNTTLDYKAPEYKWVDKGPVLESKTGDDFNAIDPFVIHDDAGQAWLAYGSSWTGIKMQKLDMDTGRPDASGKVYSLASRFNGDRAIEAPHLIKRGEYFYLFCAVDRWDLNYRNAAGRSKSVTGPYLDRTGRDMMDGASTDVAVGRAGIKNPGHSSVFMDDDGQYYMAMEYFRDDSGVSYLGISTVEWDDEGWPITALTPKIFPTR